MDTICEICVVLNNLFFVSCQIGYWILDAGYWILDTGFWHAQVAGYGLRVTRFSDS